MPPEIEAEVIPEQIPAIPQPDPNAQISPDDDPNLKLQQMVSRREKKPAEPKPEDKKDDKQQDKPEAAKGDIKKLGGEIGKALGFRVDKQVKENESKNKKEEDLEAGLDRDKTSKAEEGGKKVDGKVEREDSPTAKTEDSPTAKTIVKKKVPAAPVVDPVKVASAAATAAVKAAIADSRPVTQSAAKPEDALKSEDAHEYEVAKYMADLNPKYKDAPKVVLDHVRKSEAYAAQWEKDNKGKVFDPDDEEHDDFFSALEKPWSAHEFRNAEMEMAAERVSERRTKGSDQKFKELESENARNSIAPVVDRTFLVAASLLTRKVGEEIHEKIAKNTYEKFAEEDPITADALANSIGPLQPIIEAAIQLDDPKARFAFDPKNQSHLEWNRLLLEKEHQMAGTEDNAGKTMVSRSEYAGMAPAQRSRHWYITTEHFIEELVNDAAESARQMIEKENKRIEKLAVSRGYVIGKPSVPSNNGKSAKVEEQKPEPVKPQSPSSGGGAKIDDKSAGNPSGTRKLLDTTAGILFNR